MLSVESSSQCRPVQWIVKSRQQPFPRATQTFPEQITFSSCVKSKDHTLSSGHRNKIEDSRQRDSFSAVDPTLSLSSINETAAMPVIAHGNFDIEWNVHTLTALIWGEFRPITIDRCPNSRDPRCVAAVTENGGAFHVAYNTGKSF
jgi:hypothetical protein